MANVTKINLERYDSTLKYNNIINIIEDSEDNKFNLSRLTYLINYNREMIMPDYNLLDKYKGLLSNYKIRIEIPERFFYKPELLAHEIYGTVDLWYLILFLNDIFSVTNFNKKIINVFSPEGIPVLNEIIEKELSDIEINNKRIPYRPDLTIKKIYLKKVWNDPIFRDHNIGDIEKLTPSDKTMLEKYLKNKDEYYNRG